MLETRGFTVIDMLNDFVEIDGKPLAKRGKWSGSKRVLACPQCGQRKIVPKGGEGIPRCSCGGTFDDLLNPVLDYGTLLSEPESPSRTRESVLRNVKDMSL